MLNSALYRKTAMRRSVPYKLVAKRYWRTLLGTAGTWVSVACVCPGSKNALARC